MIMMTPPSELSFDFKPHMYSMIVKSNGDQAQTTHDSPQKLEEFLARLEEERLKIEAFKRELPLCMQLLNNAMEASRQQLQYQQRANQETRPVLEEFIPLKNITSNNSSEVKTENLGNICADHKVNWMTSAQLWNQESEVTKPSSPLPTSPKETADIKLALNGKQRINGGSGAFLPFSKDRNSSSGAAFPELALSSSHKEELDDKRNISSENNSRRSENAGNKCCNGNSVAEKDQVCGTATANQSQRKARRCWSPDLHRRFVNALHMLGGSQVATPKQIRELMKVDGLTNDEVKSHLQKYRLHTRRPSPSPQASVTTPPQVVVLGGIWVPPEYAAAAAHGGTPTALYGAHASTTHHASPPFCSTTQPVVLPHEIYPAIAPPQPPPPPPNHQLHHHPFHHQHQLHMYNNNKPPALLTRRPGSPDSDVPGSGDPSESIEDGKSESSSWKADSGGENGGERKRMDVEEGSNASVSLKF